MQRKPSHLGSKITPGPSGTPSSPALRALASMGRTGGITGSCIDRTLRGWARGRPGWHGGEVLVRRHRVGAGVVAAVSVLALLLAACGDDDGSDAAPVTTEAPTTSP